MLDKKLFEEVEAAAKEEQELLEKEKTPFPDAVRSAIWRGVSVALEHYHIEKVKE